MPLLLGLMPVFAAEDKDLCHRIAQLPFAVVPWGPPGFGNGKPENYPGVSPGELREERRCCSGLGCDGINVGQR